MYCPAITALGPTAQLTITQTYFLELPPNDCVLNTHLFHKNLESLTMEKKKKDNFPNQTRRNKLNNVSGAEEAKQNPHACPPLCLLRGATLPGMYPSLELGII